MNNIFTVMPSCRILVMHLLSVSLLGLILCPCEPFTTTVFLEGQNMAPSHSPYRGRCVVAGGVSSSALWMSDSEIVASEFLPVATGALQLIHPADGSLPPFPMSPQVIVGVFAVGMVPFLVATVEFWRRIAVGGPFGTGSDSVVFVGEDGAPSSSRGRRVLDKNALRLAYALFAVATAVLGLVLVSVLTSTPPPAE